jgi:hypothetical protein
MTVEELSIHLHKAYLLGNQEQLVKMNALMEESSISPALDALQVYIGRIFQDAVMDETAVKKDEEMKKSSDEELNKE